MHSVLNITSPHTHVCRVSCRVTEMVGCHYDGDLFVVAQSVH